LASDVPPHPEFFCRCSSFVVSLFYSRSFTTVSDFVSVAVDSREGFAVLVGRLVTRKQASGRFEASSARRLNIFMDDLVVEKLEYLRTVLLASVGGASSQRLSGNRAVSN